MDHQHNIQICAGCLIGDLRLVHRRLEEHNRTLGSSPELLFAELTILNILELITDAQAVIAKGWTAEEARLGQDPEQLHPLFGSAPGAERPGQA